MSSYIVRQEVIDSIVTWVMARDTEAHRLCTFFRCSHGELPNKLGQELLKMNVAAVDNRYNEQNLIPMYRYKRRITDRVQVFKYMQCLLYQCDEGNVPEWPLYKIVEQIQNRMAEHIIMDLPAYEKALWG